MAMRGKVAPRGPDISLYCRLFYRFYCGERGKTLFDSRHKLFIKIRKNPRYFCRYAQQSKKTWNDSGKSD